MKKLIAILLVLVLLPAVSLADELDEMIVRWNSHTHTYPAPQLSMEQYSDNVFSGDGWKMAVMQEYGRIKAIGIYALETDLILPMCILAGIVLVKDYEISDLLKYIGSLTYSYYTLRNGLEPYPSAFGLYQFNIKQQQDGYFFTIGEI